MKTITFEELAHVGSLDVDDKKPQNLEGSLLSVCLTEDADRWREIARLGGGDLHVAQGPFEVIDVHNAGLNFGWARDRNLMEMGELHEVRIYPAGRPSSAFMRFKDRDKANEEFSSRLSGGQGAQIETKRMLRGTEKLADRQPRCPDPIVWPITPAWIEYVLEHDYDGLWWDDVRDVHRLSCPRGGLNPGLIDRFTIRDPNHQ